MPRIRPVPIFPLAALKLGAINTNRVDCGSNASLDELTANPCTFLALVYPTTFTTARRIISKAVNTTTQRWLMFLSGTSGEFAFTVGHATANLAYVTNTAPLKLRGWYWTIVTVDLTRGVGERARFFSSPLGKPLSRLAVTVTTEPSGARGADAAANLQIGNDATSNVAWIGSIALSAVWNRELPHTELARLTGGGGAGFRESRPVGLWRPGLNTKDGTVVHDESGNDNHGTITGAVQSGVRPRL